MSRPTKVPAYRRHSQSGQAVVTLPGTGGRRDVVLGKYGSPESHREYARVIAEWTGNTVGPVVGKTSDLTVNELLLGFWKHAVAFYRRPDGQTTSEVHNYKAVIRTLRDLYGHTIATEFGPVALKAVRQHWVTSRIVRTQINARVHRVRRIFRWGVAELNLPVAVYETLRAVPGLQRGRSEARESTPVLPVADEMVSAVNPFLPTVIQEMIAVQRLTGMRPGEVCQMRWPEVDRTDSIWRYCPGQHKTTHHGKMRVIFLGPRVQQILNKYIGTDDFVFSPRDSERARQAARSSARKTPRYRSHLTRNMTKRKIRPQRAPGDCYSEAAYRRAITRACEHAWPLPAHLARKIFESAEGEGRLESISTWKARIGSEGLVELAQWQAVHSWSPNQLRHSAATTIRKMYGVEAARTVLGHSDIDTSELYAERDQALAKRIATEIG